VDRSRSTGRDLGRGPCHQWRHTPAAGPGRRDAAVPALAAAAGAYCVRVHEVKSTFDAVRVAAATTQGDGPVWPKCTVIARRIAFEAARRRGRHPAGIRGRSPEGRTQGVATNHHGAKMVRNASTAGRWRRSRASSIDEAVVGGCRISLVLVSSSAARLAQSGESALRMWSSSARTRRSRSRHHVACWGSVSS
jgi:hypothetical protein